MKSNDVKCCFGHFWQAGPGHTQLHGSWQNNHLETKKELLTAYTVNHSLLWFWCQVGYRVSFYESIIRRRRLPLLLSHYPQALTGNTPTTWPKTCVSGLCQPYHLTSLEKALLLFSLAEKTSVFCSVNLISIFLYQTTWRYILRLGIVCSSLWSLKNSLAHNHKGSSIY